MRSRLILLGGNLKSGVRLHLVGGLFLCTATSWDSEFNSVPNAYTSLSNLDGPRAFLVLVIMQTWMPSSLGRAIRTRRKTIGLTQAAAAHEAGISGRYYADVERGTRSVSIEVASRIAAALGTKLQSILDAVERGR